jgi:hypothetical protein
MRIATRAWTALALVAVTGLLVGSLPSRTEATPDEPQTLSLRIRLRGPTMRVRCRAGDCAVNIVGEGNLFHVSVTRTGSSPITFARDLMNPTNIAIETGYGTDSVTLSHVSIPGFLRITTGSGDDTLDVSDTSTGGKVAIDTGRGNDTVHLVPGTFGGKFHLTAHDGNDDVSLNGGHLAAKSGIDGGPGIDAFHMLAAPIGVPPIIIGFEP